MLVAVVSSALAFSRGVRPTTQPTLSALLPRHAPAQLYLADDPTGYAFMLPAATAVATSCQLCGIGGAALFSPIFLLVFPLLGPEYPLDSPAAAIASALLTDYYDAMYDYQASKRANETGGTAGRREIDRQLPCPTGEATDIARLVLEAAEEL